MEASKQNRTGPHSPGQGGGRSANAGGTLSAVGRLIERADALHLRAPELALVLGERAAALAETAGADEQWIRAESLVVSARVRLGDRPGTVGRAVAALRAAEHAGYGDIAARLRIDLAVCARSLGVPLTGLAALRPVLTDPVVSPVHRAAALCHLVGCLAQIGRKAELDRVLVEADKLVLGDESLDADTQLLVRALLRVGTAAHRRRHGDLTAAADAARTGLGFLEKLDDPADEGGLVRVRLVLQLVSTLLDRGDSAMAYEFAEPMLAEPVRAAGIAPAGWLRLAVATRIHLPSGAGEAAIEQVREAVASTERHGLSSITARLWLELAQLEERFGQAEEAIACLYRSRAAEQLHARSRRQACSVLAGEFGTGEPASVDLDEVLKATTARTVQSRPAPVAVESVARPPRQAEPPTREVRPAEPVRQARPAEPRPVVREPQVAEPVVEQPQRVPAWSFGDREEPKPPAPREPAWSFEAAREPAPAKRPEEPQRQPNGHRPPVREEPVEPPARAVAANAKAEPPWRREQVEVPPLRPDPADFGVDAPPPPPPVRPRPPADAVAGAPPVREEPGKSKFSWAALAEARLKETEAARDTASTRIMPAVSIPLAPAPAAEPEPARRSGPSWESDDHRPSAEPVPSTRHDAEHGSVAARSVLDRLGISGSGNAGGGRRRAAEEGEEPRVREEVAPEPAPAPPPVRDLAPPPRADDEPPFRDYGDRDYRDQVEPWLPKLRMPPTLEPMEDFGSWSPSTAFPESYARAIAEDEPPPDAGLADLLARALAEHQAGTASAAALVKQLGSQGASKGRNGHGRNGHSTD